MAPEARRLAQLDPFVLGQLNHLLNRRTRRQPFKFDRDRYRSRNIVERCFCRLKDFRRVATRYDRLACTFMSTVCIAAIVAFWLKP